MYNIKTQICIISTTMMLYLLLFEVKINRLESDHNVVFHCFYAPVQRLYKKKNKVTHLNKFKYYETLTCIMIF